MTENEDPKEVAGKFLVTTRIIVAVFILTVGVHISLPLLFIQGVARGTMSEAEIAQLATALQLAAIALLATAPFLSKVILKAATRRKGSTSIRAASAPFLLSRILPLAGAEAASILGLVISMLTTDTTWVLLFGGIALVEMVLAWPSKHEYVNFLSESGVDSQLLARVQ